MGAFLFPGWFSLGSFKKPLYFRPVSKDRFLRFEMAASGQQLDSDPGCLRKLPNGLPRDEGIVLGMKQQDLPGYKPHDLVRRIEEFA